MCHAKKNNTKSFISMQTEYRMPIVKQILLMEFPNAPNAHRL